MSIIPRFSVGPLQVFIYAVAFEVCVIITLTVYRLYFHPLRKFPGPKAAAATGWYEFYYDVIHQGGGQYFKRVKLMHELYGPIVRITPDEVHIDDPDWFDVYSGKTAGQTREKYVPAARMAGTSLGVFGTANYEKHRLRRNTISHFFSKQSVRRIEPMLISKIKKLCNTILEQAQQDDSNVVELRAPLLAFGTDVICSFALGVSPQGFGELLLDSKKQKLWQNTVDSLEDMTPLGKQFSVCLAYARYIPVWIWNQLWPDLGRLMQLHHSMRAVAKIMIATSDNTVASETRKARNVFETILNSISLPRSEKTHERLADEGFELIAAGGETTARAASATIFYLLTHPPFLAKVRAEADSVLGSGLREGKLQDLQALPWLSATIKETLRIQSIIQSRLPLVSPVEDVRYDKWVIPSGTPFSMTPNDILRNPHCFTDPECFHPERWMPTANKGVASNQYFVSFSRGTKSCLGINLAYAELYMIVANLVSTFEMRLEETTWEKDVDHSRDCFVGKAAKSSKGIRVAIQAR